MQFPGLATGSRFHIGRKSTLRNSVSPARVTMRWESPTK